MLHLNSLIAEPLAAELSQLTSGPAIAILEYDQATWGYCLFEAGNLIDRFWSIPDAVETPPAGCAGSAAIVARVFGVPAASITPYIHHVTEDDNDARAFTDDQFPLGNHWVRVDFMRRLGIPYPKPGQVAGGRYILVQESKQVASVSNAQEPKRKWWQFWK